ncbi:DUF2497 domain-containing protein [Rhizobiaceae bacterium BDR2-2]|uniref:DUF2497 domain-containing protein n=1 Tax=Ectorhizobium quercum TaxID=2965071 RepID=A0AAE3SW27_9HYPH|nr:DUF2497 domain-containing protein [Ectorhizobium quercum]MCX8997554.1 DUF2497 domain-containing protein [Ectorhizobium quercum]
MAQPSVAREPSMEEILASIRRIIESNEPGALLSGQAGDEPVSGFDYTEEDQAGADFADASHPVVADSAGMPLRAANTAVPPRAEREAPAAPAEKPQSLADIAARVRAAADRPAPAVPQREESSLFPQPSLLHPVAGQGAPARTSTEPAAAPEPAIPRSTVEDLPLRAAAPLHAPDPSQSVVPNLSSFEGETVAAADTAVSGYEAEAEADTHGPDLTFAAPGQDGGQAVADDAPVAESAALSLLSSETGALVARSFDELAEAVDGAQRRSLDEIAEELLRPMLREWLDDNLPTLVERLVREEIERVARGPRR